MQVQAKHNDSITIASTPFAKGGEGALYDVVSPANLRHLCAKIYHVDKRDEERERKITFLLEHNPNDTYERDVLVWVEDVLYQDGSFVGFLMPKQAGYSLEILCSQRIPKRFRSDWGYLSFKNDNALQKRMEIACRLCMAVHQLHESQRYLLIDIKPENIIIDEYLDVYIVDLDSVEVLDSGNTIFDAPVSTPEYTPPEYYKKLDYDPTEKVEWDLFGLGVIMYKLLCGIHPYTGTCKSPNDQFITISSKIEQGLIPLSDKKDLFEVIPGPHERLDKLPLELQYLFEQCFLHGTEDPTKRPSALIWIEQLLLHSRNEELVQQFYHIFDHAPLTHIASPSFKEYSFDSSVLENAELTKLKEIEDQSETFWWWSTIRFNGWMYRKFSLEVISKINKDLNVDPIVGMFLGLMVVSYSEWILFVLFILSMLIYIFAYFHKRMKENKGQFYSLQKKIVVARSFYKSLKVEYAKTELRQLQRTLKDLQKLQISITNFNAFIEKTNRIIHQQVLSEWIKKLAQSGIHIQLDSFWGMRVEITKFFKNEMDRLIDRLGVKSIEIKDQINSLRKAITSRFDAEKKQCIDAYIDQLKDRIKSMDVISTMTADTYLGDEKLYDVLHQNGIHRFSEIGQFSSSRNEIWLTIDNEIVRLPVPKTKSDDIMKGLYQWRDEYDHFSYLLKKVTVEKIYPEALVTSLAKIEMARNQKLSKSYEQIYNTILPKEAILEYNSLIAKKQKINNWILKYNQEYTMYLKPYSQEYQKRYDRTVQEIEKMRRKVTTFNKHMNTSESKKASDLLEKMFSAHSSLMEYNDELRQLIDDENDKRK